MFTKRKLKDEEIKNTTAKVLEIKETDICLVEKVDDWLERKDEQVVIEYNGFYMKKRTKKKITMDIIIMIFGMILLKLKKN